jgi:uncharacterized protein YwqG
MGVEQVRGVMDESPRERLIAAGLAETLADKLSALAQEAVRFTTQPAAEGTGAAVGVSRLGGAPDLPEGFAWPLWKQRPLTFLGQLNLGDVSRFSCCAPLPQSGILSLFYDPEQEAWGFDPRDRGSWLVHYEPNITVLRSTPSQGEASVAPFVPCSLSPVEVLTLPEPDSLAVEDLDLSSQDRDRYYGVLDAWHEDWVDEPKHQLLGHPSAIQGEMQLECQLVTNGLFCGDPSGYEDPRAASLRPGAREWRLLLQLDSDDHAEMMWGDAGRLYFWLTQDALRRRAFREAWMILQCS